MFLELLLALLQFTTDGNGECNLITKKDNAHPKRIR